MVSTQQCTADDQHSGSSNILTWPMSFVLLLDNHLQAAGPCGLGSRCCCCLHDVVSLLFSVPCTKVCATSELTGAMMQCSSTASKQSAPTCCIVWLTVAAVNHTFPHGQVQSKQHHVCTHEPSIWSAWPPAGRLLTSCSIYRTAARDLSC